MENQKESYHDYVIKNGVFIGKFEEMYHKFDDPWGQSQQPNKYARFAGIQYIKNFKIESLLECGCGLGYYAEWIHKETGIIPVSVDIAEDAIQKAQKIFPNLHFEVANIATDLLKYQNLGAVMFAEILWYILPELPAILQVLKKNFKNKYLIINQVFYKGTQKYGTEYFTNMQELINYIPFECVGKCEATTIHDSTIETSTIFKIN